MSSPVTPSQFTAVVPSPSADICSKIKLVFLQLPSLLAQLVDWMLDDNGNPSEEFKIAVSPIAPGDFKFSAVESPGMGWLYCFQGDTEVCLADGSKRTIRQIVENKESPELLSFDSTSGNLVISRPVDWFKTPASISDWYRLSVYRGNGSYRRRVIVTGNHPMWTQRGWVAVDELLPSEDTIFRAEKTLTKTGFDAMLGVYLGDGTMSKTGKFSVTHCSAQEDYLRFLASKIGMAVYPFNNRCPRGKLFPSFMASVSLKTMCPRLMNLCKRGSKATKQILEKLTPISLAFWYMDDGNLTKASDRFNFYSCRLHTEGMTEEEMHLLVEYFKDQWGIETSIWNRSNTKGKTLGFSKQGSQKFFALIAPYIHPSMKYKLPPEYQAVGFCLEDVAFVDTGLVPYSFKRDRLIDLPKHYRDSYALKWKYDIKVEGTHSFCANNFVVHNCNGQAVSRTTYAALFAAIGTTFGVGDGSTTFNVPDCRNRFLLGVSASKALGVTGGLEDVTLLEAQMPNHFHSFTGSPIGTDMVTPNRTIIDDDVISSSTLTRNTTSAGSGQSHTNMPPWLTVFIHIKY